MNMTPMTIIRVVGVCLATFLFIHYLKMPYGLIAGLAVALLFL